MSEKREDYTGRFLEEINLLLKYASERHMLTPADPAQAKAVEENLVLPLGKAMVGFRRDPNEITKLTLLLLYSKLTGLTGNVTGRSLVDSKNSDKRLMEIGIVTMLSAVLATFLSALSSTNSTAIPPAPNSVAWSGVLFSAALCFWGCFGSGIYLLKSLYDRVADGSFDSCQLQGHRTRMLLGACLAAILPRVFNLGDHGINVDAVAVAILAGLSVKVFYGALENLIDALVDRFNLGNAITGRPTVPADAVIPAVLQKPTPLAANSPDALKNATPSPQPMLSDAQRLLAGLGKYSGPMDGQMNLTMIAALRSFSDNQLSEADIRNLNLSTLLQWLRAGALPTNWRDQSAHPSQVAVAAILPQAEIQANSEAIRLLQARGWSSDKLDLANPAAVASAVDTAFKEFQESIPAARGLSFTQLFQLLQSDSGQQYRRG